jgi:hypothetical protein
MLLLHEAFHFIIHVTYRASYYTYIRMLSVVNSKIDTAVLASILVLQIMRTERQPSGKPYFLSLMCQFLHNVFTVALYL